MKENKHLWDNIKTIRNTIVLIFVICITLVLTELLFHYHAHAKWEEYTGFYAAFGFVAVLLMTLVSKYVLRPIVKRNEDYYDV